DSVNSPQAKIKIKDADDGEPVDESDAVFTISPKPFIAVLAPTGGDVFNAGDEIVIRWESAGIENVGMQYTTTNGLGSLSEPAFYNITGSTPNTGEYATSFSIPSNEYYIEIFDAGTSGSRNRSIGNFTISPQITKSITVLTPNGGEVLLAGEAHEIQWFSNGVENVNIEYSLNGGTTWTMVAAAEPSDGLFVWNINPNSNASDNCIVRISDIDNEAIKDISNGVFSILPRIAKTIRVVTPNGGELWNFYNGQVIEWTSSPSIEYVNIYYSLNNGATWDVVISGYPSYNAYEWDPPNVVSSGGRIKIEDASDPAIVDVSDGPFGLFEDVEPPDPFITLIAPEPNATWAIGTDQDIRWFTHRDIVKVDILVSYD
ncbi:MAG: hypothetical protein KAQ90_11655, partial [Melioribacteraceae bacterium]|nr:hypothetical protein [Melioribacteraceae bacterium]